MCIGQRVVIQHCFNNFPEFIRDMCVAVVVWQIATVFIVNCLYALAVFQCVALLLLFLGFTVHINRYFRCSLTWTFTGGLGIGKFFALRIVFACADGILITLFFNCSVVGI